MMKRLIVLGMVLAMVVALSVSASAFIIRIGSANAADINQNSSTSGQFSNTSDAFTTFGPLVGAEAAYVVYKNNVPTTLDPATNWGHTLKITDGDGSYTYFGTVSGFRGNYTGQFDLRFWATTAASNLAAGTWYLYKGHGVGTEADVLDSATFSTSVSTYAGSTFGAILNDGDLWTLSNQGPAGPIVPEPGSIVALLSGIVGLVGIRRRK